MRQRTRRNAVLSSRAGTTPPQTVSRHLLQLHPGPRAGPIRIVASRILAAGDIQTTLVASRWCPRQTPRTASFRESRCLSWLLVEFSRPSVVLSNVFASAAATHDRAGRRRRQALVRLRGPKGVATESTVQPADPVSLQWLSRHVELAAAGAETTTTKRDPNLVARSQEWLLQEGTPPSCFACLPEVARRKPRQMIRQCAWRFAAQSGQWPQAETAVRPLAEPDWTPSRLPQADAPLRTGGVSLARRARAPSVAKTPQLRNDLAPATRRRRRKAPQ